MTTQPTPLPPSVAELRDIIAAHYRGDALNQLCALASRADPAPVADEAAIAPLLKREWSYCLFCSGSLDTGFECNDCGADLHPIMRALRAAPRNDDKLRRILADWTHRYGSDLVPPSGWSDTYGEGMRNAKEWVRKILAESPAGDAPCQTMNSSSAADADKSLPSQSPMGPPMTTPTNLPPNKPDLDKDTVEAPRCRERHFSLGHQVVVRCDLVVGHASLHFASWGRGNTCEWSGDDE